MAGNTACDCQIFYLALSMCVQVVLQVLSALAQPA